MYCKLILPALTEAHAKTWRPIKYALFPPLGLATLAAYLDPSDRAEIVDEHVEPLTMPADCDDCPDLVGIEVYITSAKRAYAIADAYRAKGAFVVLGGLHVTACPEKALAHADTIVTGPAEEAWPRFLRDWRQGHAARRYASTTRTLDNLPPLRRDLIKRRNYLVPNSMVVSRGCPHACDFCYANGFFRGGKRFYTCRVDHALAEIEALPGRHLFFLDDNILADPTFSRALFQGLHGMGRVWQGAATVQGVLDEALLDEAVDSGLRSLFVGFETLSQAALREHGKRHNTVDQYARAIRMLHDRGVMINGSFVFGMDEDDPSVFDATAEWAIQQGIETATFHILTPYPGTALYDRFAAQGRIVHHDWDLYDTRHCVFRHPNMSAETIESGYWRAYSTFYGWGNIIRSGMTKPTLPSALRHMAYVGAWKKCDPLWGLVIKAKELGLASRMLERVLDAGMAGGGGAAATVPSRQPSHLR